MKDYLDDNTAGGYQLAGLFTFALRLVVGWTYFSAFWRRLVLDYKLDPDAAGYIGEKFNHFLPNALGIKPMIEYLVLNPEALWWSMAAFTIIEGIVGLMMMLGLFTRLMSIGVFSLAKGILLGSGWLGTTCLDEWQIGVLGIASGFTIFLSGSGKFSLDYLLAKRAPNFVQKRWFRILGSGALPINPSTLYKLVFGGAFAILLMTLFTNQYFHGGVYGDLHNKSVKPKVEISELKLNETALSFTVFRVEGADVYGSFLIGITLIETGRDSILNLDANDLASFPVNDIHNVYVAKVKPGPHSLVLPLGAKAKLTVPIDSAKFRKGRNYELILTDVSGATWRQAVTY